MTKLLEQGLQVTAVHNHLLRASPPTFYMHVSGRGDAERLARMTRVALEESATPWEMGAAPPATATDLGLDTANIDEAIGFKGLTKSYTFASNGELDSSSVTIYVYKDDNGSWTYLGPSSSVITG